MESELNSKGIVDLCWGTGVFFLCFVCVCVCVSGVLVRFFFFFVFLVSLAVKLGFLHVEICFLEVKFVVLFGVLQI